MLYCVLGFAINRIVWAGRNGKGIFNAAKKTQTLIATGYRFVLPSMQ